MPNQYTSLTADNIRRKVNRKRSPVRTWTRLANEFGVGTIYLRSTGGYGNAAPGAFRNKVRSLVGDPFA